MLLRAQPETEANKKTIEFKSQKQALDKQAKELEAKEQSTTEQIAEQLKVEQEKIAESVNELLLFF